MQENLIRFFRGFNHDANPMAIMCGVMGALSAFYNDQQSVTDPVHRELACINIIAKRVPRPRAATRACRCSSRRARAGGRRIPVVAAIAYKVAVGEPIVYPREDLTYSENLLYMMFALPTRPYVVDKVSARCLETILILHMDHEQNASTSTVRIAGSSQASPYACVAAGIASLWGPAHGGANAAVIEMLEQIGHKDRIPEFVAKAKDKNNPFRLMGFGHRVYKTMDPRAVLMRKMCHKLLDHLNMRDDPLLELAMELEKVALAGASLTLHPASPLGLSAASAAAETPCARWRRRRRRPVLRAAAPLPQRRLLQRHLLPGARPRARELLLVVAAAVAAGGA